MWGLVLRIEPGHAISRVTVSQTGLKKVTDPSAAPSPIVAGLLGRCPRCGKGRLFEGFLTLRPRCESCDLDFSFVDSADGPAFFVMFFSGFIVAGSALAVEILYAPPYWVHALLWGPLILITAVLPLRPVKGLLIALQYHNKAEEGRFTGGEAP
jgi:uncharacterized protein (DUF983 family)